MLPSRITKYQKNSKEPKFGKICKPTFAPENQSYCWQRWSWVSSLFSPLIPTAKHHMVNLVTYVRNTKMPNNWCVKSFFLKGNSTKQERVPGNVFVVNEVWRFGRGVLQWREQFHYIQVLFCVEKFCMSGLENNAGHAQTNHNTIWF